jgi:hypothetical protein
LIKLKIPILVLIASFLAAFTLPALAVTYNPGVSNGQYVKYDNFVGTGPGVEAFNDYDWLKLQVTRVSGKTVTLLSTGQYKNGTAIPGDGTVSVWNIETGTEDGVPSTQGPIIAANLNQGDAIPPTNTYKVNNTESRKYFGETRTVNVLDASISTPDYNTSVTYVYDKASGMLLESNTETTTQADTQSITTTVSYIIVDTNIFSLSPSPSVPEFPIDAAATIVVIITVIATAFILLLKKRK